MIAGKHGDAHPNATVSLTLIGVFYSVRDEFVNDKSRRNRSVGGNFDAALQISDDFTLSDAFIQILANRFNVSPHIQPLCISGAIQVMMRPGYGGDAICGFLELRRKFRIVVAARLQPQHAHHDRETVIDAMIHLLAQEIMAL